VFNKSLFRKDCLLKAIRSTNLTSPDLDLSRKSNMAASKPEVPVSPKLRQISSKLRRLHPLFLVDASRYRDFEPEIHQIPFGQRRGRGGEGKKGRRREEGKEERKGELTPHFPTPSAVTAAACWESAENLLIFRRRYLVGTFTNNAYIITQ